MGKGVKLALIGLAIGFLIGLAIRDFKLYLASQLQSLLDSEARNSCACKFESDPIQVSLLTLGAKVANAKLVSTTDGSVKLQFKKLRARFDISKITERKIFISKLDLLDGFAPSIGPQSDAYKFIAWLVAPLPAEKDTPDRWRLKLLKLNLQNFSFKEALGEDVLEASQGSMSLERDAQNNFRLKPRIGSLDLHRTDSSKAALAPLRLGEIEAALYLKDEAIEFEQIKIKRGESLISGSFTSNLLDQLQVNGSANYLIDSKSFSEAEKFGLRLQGDGVLGGTLDAPDYRSKFKLADQSHLTLGFLESSELRLEQLDGKLDFSVGTEGPRMTLTSVHGHGNQVKLDQNKILSISPQSISGGFNLQVEQFILAGLGFEGVNVRVALAGTPASPTVHGEGKVAKLKLAGLELSGLIWNGDYGGDKLSFEIMRPGQDSPDLRTSGEILLGSVQPPRLNKLQLRTEALPLISSASGEPNLWIDAQGEFSGELAADKVGGMLAFTLGAAPASSIASLQGQAKLQGGVADISLASGSERLKASAHLDFGQGHNSSLAIDAKDFSISELAPELECLKFDLHSDYRFSLAAWREGQGSVELGRFDLGCEIYKIALAQPYRYTLDKGVLQLSQLRLQGAASDINLSGTVSLRDGFDLRAKGNLDLHAILPVLKDVDELSGQVKISAALLGPYSAPKLSGEAQVSEGELGLEAANLRIEGLQGTLRLASEQVKFDALNGQLNGGVFSLSGVVLPADLKKSDLQISLDEIYLEPAESANMTLSGALKLTQSELGRPVIRGDIKVEHGEMQKEIDLAGILRSLLDYIFSAKQAKRRLSALPDIDLEVKAAAANNLFIFTNWFAAELKADLAINGTLSEPAIKGKLETLSGWFGFRDRRFEINSGIIEFKPELDQPELHLVSESYFTSANADSLVIFLEADGPLTNPRIELTSDSGLSQREVLNLLTSGQTSVGERGYGRSDTGVRMTAIPLLQDEEQYMFGRFFSRLTSIDSISLEPAYNPQRGVTDPTIVATKHLSDRLYLRGESFFSGSSDESKLTLSYLLSPKLSLSGIIDAISQEDKTALGIDLTYTALSKQLQNVKIEINGNHFFERSEIMQKLRISEMSMIEPSQIDKLKQSLTAAYSEQGYFHSQIDFECIERSALCATLNIRISEGQKSKVQKVALEGDDLPAGLIDNGFFPLSGVKNASAALLAAINGELLRKLRSEGFISARVTGSYEDIPEIPFRKLMLLRVRVGKPVSFVFSGNKLFSDEELLETINLFGRKQPFGNNTINLLVQNIERKYREAGYLFVAINSRSSEDVATGRVTFIIEIAEEARIEVSEVSVRPGSSLSLSELQLLVGKHVPELYEEILEPRYAIAEKLESNILSIRDALTEDGYPLASVSYSILPDESGLKIEYAIESEEKSVAKQIVVENWPEDLSKPAEPSGDISIPQANRYLSALLDKLVENGFVSPHISQDFSVNGTLTYRAQPGPRTIISRIRVSGNKQVAKSLILKRLRLKKGQPWNAEELYQAKTKLLKLGLFSRVEIRPLDGRLDEQSEALSLRVQEKPLRTLELGSGLNSEYGLHVFGEASDRQLFSDGRNISFRVDSYYDSAQAEISQGVASLKYTDPYILDSDYSLTEDFRFQKLDLSSQEFNLDRISLASQLYRTWEDGSSVSFSHTILQEDLNNVSPGAVLSELDRGVVDLSMLSFAFSYDRRDNPLNPQRGYTLFFNSQVALKELASDAGFYTLGSRFTHLYPLKFLSQRLSLAQNLHLQSGWTFENTPNIPITQRFYLGGRNTVRGFRENSLGPRAEDGSVIGGDVSAVANVEVRYLLAEAMALHTFLDAGNVFLRELDPEYDELRLSAGIGLRYLSPIGPIGFDLGHPLDERTGEPSLRVHFNIGSNF